MDELLAALSRVRLCVVGDLLLDVYLSGQVHRIAPDAPVPVVRRERITPRASGIAMAAVAVVELCAAVEAVGVTGDDSEGEMLARLAGRAGVQMRVLPVRGRPTTTKVKVFAQGQQLIRIDHEEVGELPASAADQLRDLALVAVGRADAVLISDYAKGVCDRRLVTTIINAARRRRIPVVVDPKRSDPSWYAGATAVTPNALEFDGFTRHLGCADQPLARGAHRLRAAGGHVWVVVTRAADGLTVFGAGPAIHVPACASVVEDVSGAGDALAAIFAAGLGAGLPVSEAAWIASLGAGLAIRSHFAKTVRRDDLREAAKQFVRPTGSVQRQRLGAQILNRNRLSGRH